MRKIVVSDYSNFWPSEFEKEKSLIEHVTKDLPAEIYHIGSTSVRGLAAKPIIDILLEVSDLDEIDDLNAKFLEIGYVARGENGIPERRYFEKGGDNRTHQIHAFLRNSDNAIRHIAFREYLRSHPKIANEYANLKKRIAQHCDNNIEKYCDDKNEFVQYHEKQAVAWYALNK